MCHRTLPLSGRAPGVMHLLGDVPQGCHLFQKSYFLEMSSHILQLCHFRTQGEVVVNSNSISATGNIHSHCQTDQYHCNTQGPDTFSRYEILVVVYLEIVIVFGLRTTAFGSFHGM